VVEHPAAGRFVLVDRRVADADLDRLLDRLLVEAELRVHPPPPSDDTAALLRDAIAAGMTARTRAQPPRRTLAVVVGAPPEPEPPATADDTAAAPVLPAIDLPLHRAHSARVYDALLGGKTNYWPDRVAADEIVQVAPTT